MSASPPNQVRDAAHPYPCALALVDPLLKKAGLTILLNCGVICQHSDEPKLHAARGVLSRLGRVLFHVHSEAEDFGTNNQWR